MVCCLAAVWPAAAAGVTSSETSSCPRHQHQRAVSRRDSSQQTVNLSDTVHQSTGPLLNNSISSSPSSSSSSNFGVRSRSRHSKRTAVNVPGTTQQSSRQHLNGTKPSRSPSSSPSCGSSFKSHKQIPLIKLSDQQSNIDQPHHDELGVTATGSIGDAAGADVTGTASSSSRQSLQVLTEPPRVKSEHLSLTTTVTSSASRDHRAVATPSPPMTSHQDRKSRDHPMTSLENWTSTDRKSHDRKWTVADSRADDGPASEEASPSCDHRLLMTSRSRGLTSRGTSPLQCPGIAGRGEDGNSGLVSGSVGRPSSAAGAVSPLSKCPERPASLRLTAIDCDNIDTADSTGNVSNMCRQNRCDSADDISATCQHIASTSCDSDTGRANTGTVTTCQQATTTPSEQDRCGKVDTADSTDGSRTSSAAACGVSSLGYELECITLIDEEPPASGSVLLEQSSQSLEQHPLPAVADDVDNGDGGLSGLDVLSCVASSQFHQTSSSTFSPQGSQHTTSSSACLPSQTDQPCSSSSKRRRFSILDLPLSQFIDDVATDDDHAECSSTRNDGRSGRGGLGGGRGGRISPDVVTAGYNVFSAGDCPTVNSDTISRLVQQHQYAGCGASASVRTGAGPCGGTGDVNSSEQRSGDVFTALKVDVGQFHSFAFRL